MTEKVSETSHRLRTADSGLVVYSLFFLLLIIVLMLLPCVTSAQVHHDSIARLRIKSGNIRVKRTSDSLRYEMQKKRFESSGNFYQKLKAEAEAARPDRERMIAYVRQCLDGMPDVSTEIGKHYAADLREGLESLLLSWNVVAKEAA